MKSLKKDYILRKIYKQKELKYRLLQSLIYNQSISKDIRIKIEYILRRYLKRSFSSRIKNYCLITGRSRGIYSKFKLSRVYLRSYILFGYIVYYKKASW